MFAFSLVAFVLAGSGLIAVMVLSNGGDGDGTTTEDCVVGTWRVVSYTEETALGSGRMIEGEPVFQFQADRTGLADFGDGVRMEVESLLGNAIGDITGQITYQYEASDRTLEFVDQQSNAMMTSDQEYADLLGPGEFTLPTGPLDHTCDGDAMTITDGGQAFEYQRAG